MLDPRLRIIPASGLVAGAALGMAGSFVPSVSLRGLLWGLDGVCLIVAVALLTVHHLRKGNDVAAAGFLVFLAGQALVLATAPMDPVAGREIFGAGVALWATSLMLVSSCRLMPAWIRVVGVIAALLFAVVALQIFMGHPLTAQSEPLPAFAYPVFCVALIGWAWQHYRGAA